MPHLKTQWEPTTMAYTSSLFKEAPFTPMHSVNTRVKLMVRNLGILKLLDQLNVQPERTFFLSKGLNPTVPRGNRSLVETPRMRLRILQDIGPRRVILISSSIKTLLDIKSTCLVSTPWELKRPALSEMNEQIGKPYFDPGSLRCTHTHKCLSCRTFSRSVS